MKVLLFTHSQDIDGMGCALLANKAFKDYTLVPTKTFDITKNVKEYIDNKKIYDYDQIYVTDLCIKEPLLKQIDEDEVLRNKLIVLDHHKTEIEEGNNKYDFVNIIVEEDGIKQSGTNLFYKYLVKNNLLEPNEVIKEIVEWTRQCDVYDWKKENNELARYLHILYEKLGYEKYLEIMDYKINNLDHMEYNEEEMSIINQYFEDLDKTAKYCLDNILVKDIEIDGKNYRVAYVYAEYKYRNDLNEYIVKDNKYDVDCIGIIMTDIDTVSYRGVKDIDVSVIGKYFGGKGHKGAASNPQNNDLFKKIVLGE